MKLWMIRIGVWAIFMYCMIVYGVAHEQAEKSFKYISWSTRKIDINNMKTSDSLYAISKRYWERRNNTLLWLPKFMR